MDPITRQILINLLLSTPNYIIFFAGLVLCMGRWDRHPTVSMLLLYGLGASAIASVLANVGIPLGYRIGMAAGGPEEARTAASIARAIAAFPYALGYGLMLYAALVDRDGGSSDDVPSGQPDRPGR